MKKYLGLLVLTFFVASSGFALAEDVKPLPGNGLPKGVRPAKEAVEKLRTEKKEAVQTRLEERKGLAEERESLKEEREATREKMEAEREEFKNMTEEEREAMKEKAEAAREALKEKREALKLKAEKLREEAKTKMENLKAKIKDAAGLKRYEGRENALHRFDEQVEKVMKLRDRVNGKISEFEAKGLEVSEAKTHVATADVKLEEAKTKIAEMNSLLGTSANELTAENKTKLSGLAKDAGKLLKEAYQELNMAVKILKTASVTSSSSTTSTTTTQ